MKFSLMSIILPYDYQKKDNKYHFVTDNTCVYDIHVKHSDNFFQEYCSSCKDIFEIFVECPSHSCPKFDSRVGATISSIVQGILSDSCNGVMYKVYKGDEKHPNREAKFERWLEIYDVEENIDIIAQQICSDECDTFYLLTDKGCSNYENLVEDFTFKCSACGD